jgi:hypothetical protein
MRRAAPAACRTRAQAYYVWYCPGSILALWMMERYGLRISLLTGFASQVVMITMSVTGVHLADPHVAYIVVWVGQARPPRRSSRACGPSAQATRGV